MGFGSVNNRANQLQVESDDECRLLSEQVNLTSNIDEDDMARGGATWSFVHGCDVSLGDSGVLHGLLE